MTRQLCDATTPWTDDGDWPFENAKMTGAIGLLILGLAGQPGIRRGWGMDCFLFRLGQQQI